MTLRISRGIMFCSPHLKITNNFCSFLKLLVEDSLNSFVYSVFKFCMKIYFGNFVWKFCLDVCLDISFVNFVRKFCLEILFGNFFWKFCLEILFGNFR